ncbi:MAG: hypothetical protein SH817_15225 [Leptospira sp.]|nr:hypothetical protein [Leptospira sp.]
MFKNLLLFSITLLFTFNCAELFQKEEEDKTAETLLLALSNNAVCSAGTSISAQPTNGTRFDFTQCSGPSAAALKLAGFTASNVQLLGGIVGTGDTSTLIRDSSSLSSTGGEKKASIQITYVLAASDSTIDVILPSTTSFSGPTFQITPSEIKKKLATGATSSLGGRAGSWASSLSQEKTLCLEVHNENGAHIFGWEGECSSVTRGTYGFEEASLSGFDFSGDRIALKINKATIKSLNIYSTNIGIAGSIL